MKTIKPMRLGVLPRPYTLQRRHRLGIAILALASLEGGGGPSLLWPETDLWRMAGEALGEDGTLDLGVPKPGAEFLVSGHAYTCHQDDKTCCAVRAELGGVQKTLTVFGDRHWDGNTMSAPRPFDRMPLDWAHAYGGPSFDENPAGMGAVRDAQGVLRLPNIEALDGRLHRPGQVGVPAGFGPVSPVRPRRFRRSGSYDPAWLEDGFPGFPDTLDARFFNAAEPDQWLPGVGGLDAKAPYALWNMHPLHACLSGRLPGLRARCFIRRRLSDPSLEEVPMQLTTAWFFPDHERVLLVYHGAAHALRDDAADIRLLMPALELEDAAPLPLEHYLGVLSRRQHEEFGALHALRDKDLLPAQSLAPFLSETAMSVLDRPLVVNQKARAQAMREDARARALAAGFDPQLLVPEESTPQLPDLDDMGEFVLGLRRRARQGMDDMEAARAKALEWESRVRASAEKADDAGDAPNARDAANAGDAAHASIGSTAASQRPAATVSVTESAPAGGPPRLRGGAFAHLRSQALQAQAQADGDGAGPDSVKMMDDAGARLVQAYRHSAHHLAAAQRASSTRSRRMRARVQRLMEGSRNLSGLDLTGIDLSDLDLGGARCRETLMERADLSGACLAGADLSTAVLVRARLDGTDLRDACLDGANLGGVVARATNFSRGSLRETILDGAVLSDCDFSEARLADCGMPDADVMNCRFDGAQLDNVQFWQETRLSRLTFAGARLQRVVWLDCSLRDVDFSGAVLRACSWVQSVFYTPARFDGAELETCCAVGTDLDRASFVGARLRQCSLRSIGMDAARFDNAALDGCDLSEARLRGACFDGADARGSLFLESNLSGASLRNTELIDALLMRGDLRGADFSGANLFRADVSMARLDASTITAGAYTRLVKTLPARKAGRA